MEHKLTNKEKRRLLEISSVFEWLTWPQIFGLIWMSATSKSKTNEFFRLLDDGMAAPFAYAKAKDFKPFQNTPPAAQP